jgi:hypothetical protein
VIEPQLAAILNTTALWLSLCSAGILATAGATPLRQVALAGWQSLWCKNRDPGDCFVPVARELDRLYMRLLSALTTPFSAFLLYAGAAMIGGGLAGIFCGAIMRGVNYSLPLADAIRWTFTPILCVGIALLRAAISPKRTLSAWISGALILAGIGIGVVTGTMHPA